MLLDMHIPDWDPAFLADYDPVSLVDLYAQADVSGVLFYCKSHLGLSYWPTPVGGIHPAAAERDLVGEMLAALRGRGIAPAAYHTTIFDNWAIENHPDWSVVPVSSRDGVNAPWHGPRYGTACPVNPAYRAYEREQIAALLARYDFDALWLDMTFWNAVCICDACETRYRREHGRSIPMELDWSSPEWTTYQSARERWLEEFISELYEVAESARPGIAVTHNFGAATHGWYAGLRTDASNLDTFAAGDIYGGRDEQLLVSKLFQHLGQRQPAEFMTTRTPDLANHVELKSQRQMTVEALATIAHNGAFLFIDAIDPRGTVNPGVYERVGRVFDEVHRWESELGGTPLADVAVYYSDDSCILPSDSGTLAAAATVVPGGDATRKHDLPHVRAVTAASGGLQRAHIPFTVLTRASLATLPQYRVLVLPDVIRMDADERAAIRGYVAAGGSIYASGRTSLLDSTDGGGGELLLEDVFGTRLLGAEDGAGIYLTPTTPLVGDLVVPERHLGHGFRTGWVGDGYRDARMGLPRVAAGEDATVLATLTLPYAYPSPGSMQGHDFASIHSSPPWTKTAFAAIVDHRYGNGRSLYTVAPIERGGSATETLVFVSLIAELLGDHRTLRANTHPDVWVTVFAQPDRSRIVISALEYRETGAPAPLPFAFEYRLPAGVRARQVVRLSDGEPVSWSQTGDLVSVDPGHLSLFEMYALEHDPA